MDPAQIPRHLSTKFLVEFNGDVLLVVLLAEDRLVLLAGHIFNEDDFLGFQVFRPDYSEKMWVKVDKLGDQAFFIHNCCSFSLPASDMGCKKNCIYHPKSLLLNGTASFVVPGDLIQMYDLETERWIDE